MEALAEPPRQGRSTKRSAPNPISIQSSMLYDRLKLAEPGDTISYQELAKVAECDVRAGTEGYGYLLTARRKLLSVDRKMASAVPGVGLKILELPEVVEYANDGCRRIYRAAGRYKRRSVRAVEDVNRLTRDQRLSYFAALNVLGVVSRFTHQGSLGRAKAGLNKKPEIWNVDRTIGLFVLAASR